MELTRIERALLAGQHRILAELRPNEGHGRIAEAFEQGYEAEYAPILRHVREDALDEDSCREVHDILRMFSALHAARDKHGAGTNVRRSPIAFAGFSAHEEAAPMMYALYLRHAKPERYADVISEYSQCNSATPTLPRYRRMLAVWRAIEEGIALSAEDVRRIAEAAAAS